MKYYNNNMDAQKVRSFEGSKGEDSGVKAVAVLALKNWGCNAPNFRSPIVAVNGEAENGD